MAFNNSFSEDNNQSHAASGKQQAPAKDKADEKLTLKEEADLTPLEIEEMEQKHAEQAYKGSSGPEEKDIAV